MGKNRKKMKKKNKTFPSNVQRKQAYTKQKM